MKEQTGSCVCEYQIIQDGAQAVAQAMTLLQPHFRRAAAYHHATDYLRGLIAEVERKNGWQLAEQLGYTHPPGIQRILARYVWEPDAVRDDLRRYIVAQLGDPQSVLVVDETGFPKQGRRSAGVARQYSGTLGKIANCQIRVFLGYASPKGQVLLDRELFLPKEWARERERCRRAGIPEDVQHRPKAQLAWSMPWMVAFLLPGLLGMKSTAATGNCGRRWKCETRVTCWPSAATST